MRKYFGLNYPNATGNTFLTGVRCGGTSSRFLISGFYTEPTGQIGFLYLGSLRGGGQFHNLAFPSHAGAIVSATSPYGPNWLGFNNQVVVVGSYTTFEQPANEFGFLFRGTIQGVGHWRSVNPPDAIRTVLHSTIDNWVVGNYDTNLITDRGVLYNITRRLFQDIVKPGASFTKAFGICRFRNIHLICGSFENPGDIETGYVVELHRGGVLRNWREFHYNDNPALPTRFTGISSYPNGVIIVTGDVPSSFLLRFRRNRPNEWQPLSVPNSLTTSANSVTAEQEAVVGVYTTPEEPARIQGFTSRASFFPRVC